MIDLKTSCSKFSNILPFDGLKAAQGKGSTPPLMLLGTLNTSNLAPLNSDTVSFTGRGGVRADGRRQKDSRSVNGRAQGGHRVDRIKSTEEALSISADVQDTKNARLAIEAHTPSLEFFDNSVKNLSDSAKSIYRDMLPFASQIHDDAKKLEELFEIKMCIFDCLLSNNASRDAKGTKGPLAAKEMRVKSTQSIANKLANKFGEMKEENDYLDVYVTTDIAKSKIHDALGARLILQNGQVGETNAVINQLIKSIESGNGPKIKAIKNYGKNQRYLNQSKIEQLEEVIAKAGYKHPVVTDRKKLSGYTATHIIIEVGNGIDAEIQILGRGVNRVKHVDDICYKGLQGKHVKGLSPEILKELKQVGQNPTLTLYFNKYLTSAYELAKREWDRLPDHELEKQKFPAINTDILPACLDLNNIEEELNKNSGAKSSKKRN